MRFLVFLALLIGGTAGAADVYRWVDANGQTHYSDQWQPGAEKLRITTPAPATGAVQPDQRPSASAGGGAGSGARPAGKAGNTYDSVEIARPAQEEVLWNIDGQLPVAVRVNPALQPGDGLRLYLDGKEQPVPPGSTETQLQEVYRGSHTLKAAVVNSAGAVLIESPTISFAVRQTSVLNPNRPNIP